MNQLSKKFVFAKNIIQLANNISVEKYDVGIIEKETENNASIFFIRIWQRVDLKQENYEIFLVKQTGDAFSKKICNICHKLLDTTNFSKNQNGINNRPIRRPSCNSCRKILEGIEMKSKSRVEWLKSKPENIPFECPICGKKTIAGVTSKVVLDHNHITGEPRAWICDSCNTGIGRFKDDISILQRAIKFLS